VGDVLDRNLLTRSALELEELFRMSATNLETREMTSQAALAHLAPLLRRLGRHDEAVSVLQAFESAQLRISENGAWVGASAAGYHWYDKAFSRALIRFLHSRGARRVADFGCGVGLYVRDLRRAGFAAYGWDGNPATSEITEGRCKTADLSQDVNLVPTASAWTWMPVRRGMRLASIGSCRSKSPSTSHAAPWRMPSSGISTATRVAASSCPGAISLATAT